MDIVPEDPVQDRKARVIIHTIYIMEGLIDSGMLSGPKILTEKGKTEVEKMISEGFKPTEEEVKEAMGTIMRRYGTK